MSPVTTAVLWDSCQGCDGSIWYLTVQFHSPAILPSMACGAPGVAALTIFSIIALCCGDICGGASSAKAAVDRNTAATATAIIVSFIGILQVGIDRRPEASKGPAIGQPPIVKTPRPNDRAGRFVNESELRATVTSETR